MKPAVSVIIPVYNSSSTLLSCAGNLVHQTLSSIELLFIDDCSSDNSYELLLAIQKQFPDKVSVYRTSSNAGPGGARNLGLSHASGQYIGFVDSDDLADPSMFQKLYECALSGNADFVDCSYIDEAAGCIRSGIPAEWTGTLTDEIKNQLISTEGFLWNKLFRSSLIEDHNLRFREHCTMEDTDFCIACYAFSKCIGTVPEFLYRHTDNSESITHHTDYFKVAKNSCAAMNSIFAHLNFVSNAENNSLKPGAEAMMISLAFCSIMNLKSALKECSNTCASCTSASLENIHGFLATVTTDFFRCVPAFASICADCAVENLSSTPYIKSIQAYLPQGFDENCLSAMRFALTDPENFLS